MTNTKKTSAAVAVAFAALAAAGDAMAGDARIELGGQGAGSNWRGDAAAWGSFGIAYRFADLIGPYGELGEGYGRVDQRMLTLLGIGAKVWLPKIGRTRPHLRLGFLHQHEESLSVVSHEYFKALFGIGDGIRHRAGGELGLGLDITLVQRKAVLFYAVVDGAARVFPDHLGPMVYGGGGVSLGVSFDFSGGAS